MSPFSLGILGSARVAPSGGGVYFADNFNRADGALGSDWTARAGTNFAIVSNMAKAEGGSVTQIITTATAAPGNDYYVQAVIAAGSTAGARGIIARANASTLAFYLWYFSGSIFELYWTPNNSTFTKIGSTYTASPSQPITLRLEVQGSAIRGYVDGVLRASGTDSNIPTGTLGGMRKAGSGIVNFDDFEMGAL